MNDPALWQLIHHLRRRALEDIPPDLPAPQREAHLFAAVLSAVPLGVEPDETLAGDLGRDYLPRPEREALEAAIAACEPSPCSSVPAEPSPAEYMARWFDCRAGYTTAHTCLCYEEVIRDGLAAKIVEVGEALKRADGPAVHTLRAMLIALEAVGHWAGRYAGPAREQALEETDCVRRDNLLRIAEACGHVPMQPARSFHEALQAIWLTHVAIGISELSDSSLSLGRADQYLYPLYCADLRRGVAQEQLRGHLRDFWLKLNRFGDPACAVNLGGADGRGGELYNPLSAMMIDVSLELRLPSPLLAVRVHEHTPPEVFSRYADPDLLSMGQPTFYGEEPCVQAMVRRGLSEPEARRVVMNSCMGLVIPGEEISDMWGGVVNLLLPLELALGGGQPLHNELPIEVDVRPQETFGDFAQFREQFAAYLRSLITYCVERNATSTRWMAEHRPNPLLSALTKDCIARGLDRAAGGARYHCVIIEGFGWANAADSLTAIDHLVFREQRCSLDDLARILRDDFAGAEDLHRELLRMPKYGNGHPEADAMARWVTDTFAAAVSAHSADGRYYLPSYHTLTQHVAAGMKTGASADGRRAGEPLGKNAGTMPGRATQGLTGLLLSASAIDQQALSGGQALDISIDRILVAEQEGKAKFRALLSAYYARGGLQVQVNGVGADDLRAAIAAPAAHRDLTVRIAGYSARFITLPTPIQEELVTRLEAGM